MEPGSFYFFLVDEGQRKFNILGPISDDRVWCDRCSQAKHLGRKVRVFAYQNISISKEKLAASYAAQEGYIYVETLLF